MLFPVKKFKEHKAGRFCKSIGKDHILKGYLYAPGGMADREEWVIRLERKLWNRHCISANEMLLFAVFCKKRKVES